MGEDGGETFAQTAAAGFSRVSSGSIKPWIACFARECSLTKMASRIGDHATMSGGMRKSQCQSSFATDQSPMVKPARMTGREIVDAEPAELNHETENAGESSAFGATKPGRVHFHHARRAEGLQVTVNARSRRRCEAVRERREAEDDVDHDRAGRADEHRAFCRRSDR